jgi:hypothetical protein
MSENKPNNRNKRRGKRRNRKPQPMATAISELLPSKTVVALRRLSSGAKKRSNRK